MSGFLYFIPGIKGLSRPDLGRYGLASVIGDAPFTGGEVDRGPLDAGPGFLFALDRPGRPKLSAAGETKRWRQCTGGCVLGFDSADPPSPENLMREDAPVAITGKMSDGHAWALPAAKVLPAYFGLDDDGNQVVKFRHEWRELGEIAAKVDRAITRDGELIRLDHSAIPPAEAHAIAVTVLSKTYHVGPWELDALQIPTASDRFFILQALVDVLGLYDSEEAAKKNCD